MRVLVVSPYTDEAGGGVGVATSRLVDALRSESHDVTLLTDSGIDNRGRGRVVLWDGRTAQLRPKPMSVFWGDFGPRWDDALEIEQIQELVASIQAEVIHVQHAVGLGLDALPLLSRAAPDTPLIYTHHDAWAVCLADGTLLRRDTGVYCSNPTVHACARCNAARGNPIDERTVFARNLYSRTLLRTFVQAHTCPSRYFASRLQNDLGVGVEFLPNVPPAPATQPRSDNRIERRSRIGFFGQLAETKGILGLITAVERYNSNRSSRPVTLDIYGGGPLLEPLRDRIPPQSGIVVHGHYRPQEATRLMQRVDWVAVPSTWPEVSPIVIHEALAAGTPVMVASRGGKQEHVDFSTNALPVADDSIEAWVEAIERSQRDAISEQWPAMSRAAQPRLTIREALDAHLLLYERLIHRGAHPVSD